jgi:hypothetical protein
MENPIDGTDGKLERGFMSADKLEEIDIGDGDKSRPTFINANLDSSFREGLIKLLKECKDCFAWDYSKMPGLDRSIMSIGCQSSLVLGLTSNLPEKSTRMKYWPT